MEIVDNSTEQFPHFFFQGFRVPPGGIYLDAERVGVLAVKQTVSSTGVVGGANLILQEDVFYDPPFDPEHEPPPIRLESDLATTKPLLDVVVVRNVTDVPEFRPETPVPPPPIPAQFGEVTVNRSGVAVPDVIASLAYGWKPRVDSPRVEDAGDPVAMETFPSSGLDLPVDYLNSFLNGGRNPISDHLQSGDSVVLEEQDALSNPTGVTYSVTIPALPSVTIKVDGEALEQQPDLNLSVDTVLFDRLSDEFLLTSRTAFAWLEAYDLAVLEIT